MNLESTLPPAKIFTHDVVDAEILRTSCVVLKRIVSEQSVRCEKSISKHHQKDKMCDVSETFFISLPKAKVSEGKKVEKEQITAGHPVINYSFVDKLWSFEIAGGKDQNAPLTVINVKKNGLAKRSGIKVGDEIMFINSLSTENMTLQEAQLEIQEAGRSLKIIVRGYEKLNEWKVFAVIDKLSSLLCQGL